MTPDEIRQLVQELERFNAAYRSGTPEISDAAYDTQVERLRAAAPDHPFLTRVEPEVITGKIEVRHPEPMLSLEKAYTVDALRRFVDRVEKTAAELDLPPVIYRVTVKLDGLAARDDGTVLATRGNGRTGYEISSVFEKGVQIEGGKRGQGLGEIVIDKAYFETHLSGVFEHPRNMAVGIVSADTVNVNAAAALEAGAVRFVPYTQLPSWTGDGTNLLDTIVSLYETMTAASAFPQDGLVIETSDPVLQAAMGATSHHNRWQIAFKQRGETVETTVESVAWQVGRTGNITPVLRVSPVSISGATIRRVTAHHAGMVKDRCIGAGARIEIIRSGEVIPKLEAVRHPSDTVDIPHACPSCKSALEWENDFLKCRNPHCPAQVVQGLVHWFKTIGNADWFGIKTVEKIVSGGYTTLESVYQMTETDFLDLGFGPVQSANLDAAITASRSKPIEDWRFLAAFGIPDLGTGDSRKLLARFPIDRLTDVTADQIKDIHGFGAVTSQRIEKGIRSMQNRIRHMIDLGFSLESTPIAPETPQIDSPIAGKKIVFTGKMTAGTRETMQAAARAAGAIVQTSVSAKTDILVCGEKVGAKKIEKATAAGVTLMTEADYNDLVKD